MARLGWEWELDRAIDQYGEPTADELRRLAKSGETAPPDLLRTVAKKIDNTDADKLADELRRLAESGQPAPANLLRTVAKKIDDLAAARLAGVLRRLADSGEPIPPDLLRSVAKMIGEPRGHLHAKLKLAKPQGGRRPKFDWVVIGRIAHDAISGGEEEGDALSRIAEDTGCDEMTVWRALRDFRIALAA